MNPADVRRLKAGDAICLVTLMGLCVQAFGVSRILPLRPAL